MLECDPKSRAKADAMLEHPWIKMYHSCHKKNAEDLGTEERRLQMALAAEQDMDEASMMMVSMSEYCDMDVDKDDDDDRRNATVVTDDEFVVAMHAMKQIRR